MTYINVSEKPVVSREFLIGKACLNVGAERSWTQSAHRYLASFIELYDRGQISENYLLPYVIQQYRMLLLAYDEAPSNVTPCKRLAQ